MHPAVQVWTSSCADFGYSPRQLAKCPCLAWRQAMSAHSSLCQTLLGLDSCTCLMSHESCAAIFIAAGGCVPSIACSIALQSWQLCAASTASSGQSPSCQHCLCCTQVLVSQGAGWVLMAFVLARCVTYTHLLVCLLVGGSAADIRLAHCSAVQHMLSRGVEMQHVLSRCSRGCSGRDHSGLQAWPNSTD
jgi:hypothetical protein